MNDTKVASVSSVGEELSVSWFTEKGIDEVLFCREFLQKHPMVCINDYNRLPVSFDREAPVPSRWLSFLDELLYPEDILTLQEFLQPLCPGNPSMFFTIWMEIWSQRIPASEI